jgi:hypothetical protein
MKWIVVDREYEQETSTLYIALEDKQRHMYVSPVLLRTLEHLDMVVQGDPTARHRLSALSARRDRVATFPLGENMWTNW